MPKPFNILIAEDDPNDLELLTVALRGKLEPSQIRTVHDGEELLQYVRGEGRFHNRQQHPTPDLILLDLKMPRIDGLEALASLRRENGAGAIPIVMLSGSALDSDIRQAYRLGVNTYFTKPPDFEGLRDLVRKVLDYWLLSQQPAAPAQPR